MKALSSSQFGYPDALSIAALPPVLILGDHLGYGEGIVHGVTSYFLDVLPALKNAGVQLTVSFLRKPHPAAELLVAAGIAPVFLAAARLNPLVVFEVAALVRRQRCRIIHAAGIKATLVARIVGRLTGARVLIHLHDLTYPSAPIRLLHWLLSRATDSGLCLSDAARVVATRGYCLSPQRQIVIHNGIHLDRFRNIAAEVRMRIRTELGVSAAAPVLGMVARFFPVKGHRDMLHIMARIAEAIPDAILILVGDGPERAACELLSAQLGLQRNLRFAGQRSDIPELLTATDVVVVPSISEGLGLAGIEALAAARPVVAYDVGGLPEVVTDGVDGRVVTAGDQKAFAEATVALLRDSGQLRRFSENARQNAERFSLDRHIQRLLECYRDTAESS